MCWWLSIDHIYTDLFASRMCINSVIVPGRHGVTVIFETLNKKQLYKKCFDVTHGFYTHMEIDTLI